MVSQIDNSLQPTRNLKTKYVLNSKLIKRVVENHEAGILSVCQFLVKCSHSCIGYERIQRHWILGIEHDHESNGEVFEDDINVENEIALKVPQNALEVVQNSSNCMVCLVTTSGENVGTSVSSNTLWSCLGM